MKWTIAVLSALLAAAGLADGSHDAPPGRLESVAALVDFLARDEPGSRLFSVTGLVSHVDAQAFVLEDGDARVYLLKALAADPAPGARVRVKGNVFVPETDISIPFMLRPEPVVNARQLDVLDQGEPPPPLPLAIGDIDPARHHLATIRTTGTVAEETVDKVDPNYLMLIVEDGDSSLPVSMRRTAAGDGKRFTGAKVEVTGLFWRNLSSVRKFSGPFLTANGPADIRIVSPPAADPLDAPNLEPLRYVSPFMVSHMGRRSVCGRVLATWGPNRLMLLSEDGRAIPVELSGEGPLPEYGARIAVAGRPQTDLFQIKLAAASYRPLADDGKFPAPRTTNLDKVFIYDGGQTFYHAECNGSLVSFEGKVINLPNSLSSPGVMLVDCGRFVVPVDAGTHRQALDGLELGCVVRVTGVCVLEGSVWSTENVLPRIESFRVVVRNADDVGVLARPPWWTPLRLGLAIGVLLA
ncbi:MAG: hypothetical protein IJ829_02450, partial [Kiritimatiellae bacterium]|nr:hypothetical protein [Kiritimatiellia bacterium]